MSAKRVNLVSLLALLFLVLVVAVTPEARQIMARLADWVEGVEEKLEASRREEEAGALPAEEEGREAPEAAPVPAPAPAIPPHVVQREAGKLYPEAGYSWITGDPADHRVEWKPGVAHPEHPHVVASEQADQWRPAAGYDWADAKGVDDLGVEWKPGRPHSACEHVLAAEEEGEWRPEPGYRWLNDDPNDLAVLPESAGVKPPS